MSNDLVNQLKTAVASGDEDEAGKIAKNIVNAKIDVGKVVDELSVTMREVGDKFGRLELFLSDLMLAAEAMKAAMAVFQPLLVDAKGASALKGKIVIGTVQGDVHDIGKNMVSALLTAGGFEVIDIGVEVPARQFIEKAEEADADLIAASALMTTTIPFQEEIIKILNERGIREAYKILVGGGAVTAEDAKRMGADGFAPDAAKAVEEAKKILGVK